MEIVFLTGDSLGGRAPVELYFLNYKIQNYLIFIVSIYYYFIIKNKTKNFEVSDIGKLK